MTTGKHNKPVTYLVLAISLIIPLLVALLYFIPKNNPPAILSKLPLLNATVNGTTFILLIIAWRAILKGKRELHRKLMFTCLGLSALFLTSYVTYHSTHPSTSFGGEGLVKGLYYFILVSHILLSVVIVPLVLISLVRALQQRFPAHRKIARVTLPLWLYVALTGVLVYLLIAPYYA